jgi:uncharacterized RDD family membrane protein YckC
MENKIENYAGFWIRFLAYVIDNMAVGTIVWLLVFPALGALGLQLISPEDLGDLQTMDPEITWAIILSVVPAISAVYLLVTWMYYALLQSSARQATIGKMALNLVVVDINGGRLTFARASLRFFSKIISSAIFMIGYIMAAFTEKNQALHDIIANTYVVRKYP